MNEQDYIDELIAAGATDDEIVEALAEFRKRQPTAQPTTPTPPSSQPTTTQYEPFFRFLDEDKDKPWYEKRFVPTKRFNELIDTPSSAIGQFGRTVMESLSADPLKLAGIVTSKNPLNPFNPIDVEDNPLYKAGEAAEEFAQEQTYVNPEKEGEFAVQVGGGLGTAASIMATGGFSGFTKEGVGWLPRLWNYGKQAFMKMVSPAGVVSGAMQAVPEYEAAKASGADDVDAFKVLLANYGVGQTDILPLSAMLSKLNSATGGGLIRTLKNMGEGALMEGVQEAFQQYLTNQIAKGNYDPDRDPLVGLAESAGLGAFIGALIPGGGAIAQRALLKAEADETIGMITDTGDAEVDKVIDQDANEVLKSVTDAEKVQENQGIPPQAGETTEGGEANSSSNIQQVPETGPEASVTQEPVVPNPVQLVKEFNDSGSLMGQTEGVEGKAATKPAMAENVADFLREKGVTTQQQVDSFVDEWNASPIEGKPVLKIADAKRIGDLVVTKPTTTPKETIQLTFQQAVKDLNNSMSKGIRKGQQLVNENLIPKVQEALKQANLTPRQTSTILTKLKGANLFTPGSYSKLNDFIGKVVGDAQFAEKISKGRSLQKRVRKFGRQKTDTVPVPVKVLAREFGKIDPTQVEDIDEHLVKADQIISAFKPIGKGYARVNETELDEYIEKTLGKQEQEEEIKTEALPKDTTELKAVAKQRIQELSQKDLSGFDEREKGVVEAIKKINVDDFNEGSADTIVKLIKSVDNLIENDNLSNTGLVEALAGNQQALNEGEKVIKEEKVKPGQLTWFGETFYNLSNMFKSIYQNPKVEALLRQKLYGPVVQAGSESEKLQTDASNELDDKIQQVNKEFKTEIREIENQTQLSAFGMLYQLENEGEMNKVKRNIRKGISDLRAVGDEDAAKAWEKVYGIYENANTAEEVLGITKKTNPAVYEIWKFFGNDGGREDGKFTSKMAEESSNTSKEVFNREFAPKKNYTPFVQHKVNKLFNSSESIAPDAEGAQQKPTTKPKEATTSLKRTLNLGNNMVYTNTPLDDWILKYGETIYRTKAAKSQLAMSELIKNKRFIDMVGGYKNAEKLSKAFERLVAIQTGTYRAVPSNNVEKVMFEFSKGLRSIGTIKALASVSQFIKQPVVLVKTMANLQGDADLIVPATQAVMSMKSADKGNPINKLLEKSTLISRGLRLGGTDRGGSEAYKISRGPTKEFYKKIEKARVFLDKKTRANLSFLIKPDLFSARTSFIAYYLQGLRQQGVTDIDLNTEYKKQDDPARKQAMAYAENMIEQTQTSSNPAAMSQIQSQSKSIGYDMLKTILLPFSTFDVDFKARMINEIQGLGRNPSRTNAIKFAGTVGEAVTYAAVSGYILTLYKDAIKDAIRALTGGDAPEENDEKKAAEKDKRFWSSLLSAINPLAVGTIGQDKMSWIINEIGYQTSNPNNLSKKDWIKENAIVYEPYEKTLSEQLGVYSTGFSPLSDLAVDSSTLYNTISDNPTKVVDAYGNEKNINLSQAQQNILILKMMAESLTLMGLTEADVANAIRAVYKEQIKRGDYNAPDEKPSSTKKKRQFE